MKVSELIESLKVLPPDMDVWVSTEEGSTTVKSVGSGLVIGEEAACILDCEEERPPRYLRGTEVFVDGKKVRARGINSASSARGKWMSIEADEMPRSGAHTLRIILPDLTIMEWECAVTAFDDEDFEVEYPRFYPIDDIGGKVVDNP